MNESKGPIIKKHNQHGVEERHPTTQIPLAGISASMSSVTEKKSENSHNAVDIDPLASTTHEPSETKDVLDDVRSTQPDVRESTCPGSHSSYNAEKTPRTSPVSDNSEKEGIITACAEKTNKTIAHTSESGHPHIEIFTLGEF